MCRHGFIKKNTFFTLEDDKYNHNKAALVKPLLDLVRIYFSHLLGDPHQVRTVISVEGGWFSDFNAHIAFQVDMIQVVRGWPEYVFSTFAKFLRALCRQMSQRVSQPVRESVSELVSRPREMYKFLFKAEEVPRLKS